MMINLCRITLPLAMLYHKNLPIDDEGWDLALEAVPNCFTFETLPAGSWGSQWNHSLALA
jgi:hypothetical protein